MLFDRREKTMDIRRLPLLQGKGKSLVKDKIGSALLIVETRNPKGLDSFRRDGSP